jgi:hypothetical protein
MKKLITAIVALAIFFPAASQTQVKTEKHNHNEAGIEAGGAGLYYNIFYQQHLVRIGDNKSLNLRVGGAIYPLPEYFNGSRIAYHVSLMPNMLFFSKRHAWETGLGLSFIDQTSYGEYANYQGHTVDEVFRILLIVPQGSYRYYFAKNKFYLRGSLLLLIKGKIWDNYEEPDNFVLLPWAGLSAGITL